MYCLEDKSFTQDVDKTPVVSSPAAGRTVTTIDEHLIKARSRLLLPSTLLTGSATEFDLQCESDADSQKPTKRRRTDNSVAAAVNRAADSASDDVVIATASSVINGVDNGTDVTDSRVTLDTTATGMKISEVDVLPHLKHKKNYNTKVSHC